VRWQWRRLADDRWVQTRLIDGTRSGFSVSRGLGFMDHRFHERVIVEQSLESGP